MQVEKLMAKIEKRIDIPQGNIDRVIEQKRLELWYLETYKFCLQKKRDAFIQKSTERFKLRLILQHANECVHDSEMHHCALSLIDQAV